MEHYAGHLMHQMTKLPGAKYINDVGTGWGRIYFIEFNGVKHAFAGIPIEHDEQIVFDIKKIKKPDPIKENLLFSDFLKETNGLSGDSLI
jgi:hypothetical protein